MMMEVINFVEIAYHNVKRALIQHNARYAIHHYFVNSVQIFCVLVFPNISIILALALPAITLAKNVQVQACLIVLVATH